MKKEKISEEKNKKLELICIVGLIIIALLYYLFTNILNKPTAPFNQIVIYKGDNEVALLDIKKLSDKKMIVYETTGEIYAIDYDDTTYSNIKEKYEYNILSISNKKISCTESNCPNQVCVAHGELRDDIDNDMIICAPHKLTIIYK